MKWVPLSCVAALSILAGCESIAVSPALFGPESSFGYQPAPSAPERPLAALDPRPTGAVAPSAAAVAGPQAPAVILPVVPDPELAAAAPAYDHGRDPYITSVLLPPVASETLSIENGPRTADGRPILPQTPAPRVIEIGSVRSGLEASAALD